MASSDEQTTPVYHSPSAPCESGDTERTNILQNQMFIIQCLQNVTSKLDSISERLSRVEKKVECMDVAPPPYSSAQHVERGRGGAFNEERIIHEIGIVHESVTMNTFYTLHQKVRVHGIIEKEGENIQDVIRKFMLEVLGQSEENIKKYFLFACRMPRGGGGRPAPVVIAFYGDGRSHFVKSFYKKQRELAAMNITMYLIQS